MRHRDSARPRPSSGSELLAAATLCALAASCSDSDDNESFTVSTSQYTYAEDGLLTVGGTYAVARAIEADSLGGGDLNGDTDTGDEVAVIVNLVNADETVSGAAAREAHVLDTNVYLIVDEAGNNDWNSNAIDETVLLRWSAALTDPEFVSVMEDGSSALVSDGRLWFQSGELPMAADETSLRFVDVSAPGSAQTVFSDPGTTGMVTPTILADESGLLLVALDETANGDQNGDTDDFDTRVLAVVESGATNPTLYSSSLAMPTSGPAWAVRLRDVDTWDVAVLVDEGEQNANLNGTLTLPLQCTSGADTDTADSVLHVARFEMGALGVFTNTELPGVINPAANRIVLTDEVVALASQESKYGPSPGCDLNGDTDFDDIIVRWAPLDDLQNAEALLGLMRATDSALPGGARGLVALSDRLVVAERQTVATPGGPEVLPVLGWVDPTGGTEFEEDFFDPEDTNFSTPILVSVDWLSDAITFGRTPLGLLESGTGLNLNLGCTGVVKDNGTADTEDTIAAWMRFDSANQEMILAGVGWAVQSSNSGMVLAGNNAFFRVSESEDGFDWNADSDLNDFILFRSLIATCEPTNMGLLNTQPGESAIRTDGSIGAAYTADEALSGVDLNGDGVVSGYAVRTFRF